ncbi:ABC transporter substrate-binding protein [methanotrophic endosymbiont of Bathymodiolus puteoserpentis (Logatchev)]|uniref:ABC transporter substrate-binding protein n=1 Tax=methanotrophic endosymbiont of Bathymodiolus puteoserpentis (Logatchev) TaxID=343235 RepID=UPI0013C5FE43|nr:ABC transporter substrate-binding protein [methanotrophic endosymbiont of Bathymodiolus puteoserpentis (Logatchev)]SHE21696.1 ABC-type transport system involved in resistance to organic solvents, auxiliary component [methanotrophic endosymbiont of Bathymodiolus puteoserpentis (Logatchev)]
MMLLTKMITAFFLLFLSQLAAAEEVAETEIASQVVQGFQSELLHVMQQGEKLNFDQRFEQLKPVVIKTHDLAKITRIIVSKEWKKLTKEQKQELIQKFSTLSIASYAHYFKSFSGESFKIESVKQLSPGQIYVHTFLVLPDDKDVSMDYLLKKTGHGWRIINIITNGVSDLALKRSEYVSVIRKSGFDALITEISAKIKKFSQ